MERFLREDCDPRQLSPLTLAFVGDCVFELFVREELVCRGNCPVKKLHQRSVEQVCAAAQANFSQKLWPHLTEEEQQINQLGRNDHVNQEPKKASEA